MVRYLTLLRRFANNGQCGSHYTTNHGPTLGLGLIHAGDGQKRGPLFLLMVRPFWNAIMFLYRAQDNGGVVRRLLAFNDSVFRRCHRGRRTLVTTLWVLRGVFNFFSVNNGINKGSIRIVPESSHFLMK